MKKRIVVYGTFILLFLLYFGASAFIGACHTPSKANYDQLEIGMTKSEARSLLGIWPDDTHRWVRGQVHEDWFSDEGAILLAFDAQDQLIWKDWVPERKRRRPTLTERIEGLFVIVRD